jgi:hypothetical protein
MYPSSKSLPALLIVVALSLPQVGRAESEITSAYGFASATPVSVSVFSLIGAPTSLSFSQALPSSIALNKTVPGVTTATSNSSGFDMLDSKYDTNGVLVSYLRQDYTIKSYAASFSTDFTLSANSIATFTSTLTAVAGASFCGASWACVESGTIAKAQVSSSSSMAVSGPGFNSNAAPQDATARQSVYAVNQYPYNGVSTNGQHVFIGNTGVDDGHFFNQYNEGTSSLLFANLTNGSLTGTLSLTQSYSVKLSSAAYVVAVPEADTTLLALAGVCMVLPVVAGRRRSA